MKLEEPDTNLNKVSNDLLEKVRAYLTENLETSYAFYCRESPDDTAEDSQHISKSYGNRHISKKTKQSVPSFPTYVCEEAKPISNVIDNLDEPFSTTLLRLIEAKGKTNAEVYKRANMDRKHFSKIISSKNYVPSKRAVMALAIALELPLDEAGKLLERAGYAISHSQVFDVIIEYFIVNGKYDIFEINEVLFNYDQPLLGAK